VKLALCLASSLLLVACNKESPTPLSSPPPTPVTPPPAPAPPPDVQTAPAEPTASGAPEKLPAAIAGEQTFSAKLFAQLAKQPGNLFFSPTSIRLALAMTAAGARGTTATELDAALGLPSDATARADAYAGFGALLERLAARGRVELPPNAEDWQRDTAESRRTVLVIANRVWPQTGKALLPDFTKTLATSFGSTLAPLDFIKDPDAARTTINRWVSDRTAAKIPELLAPPNVTTSTRLVLTNAIYFKARWANPFMPSTTQDAPFTLVGGKKTTVPMMRATAFYPYGETAAYQFVSLAYGDGSLAMHVLLPKKGHTLAEVEAAALSGLGVVPQSRRVALSLPKFRLSGRFELADVLRELGVRSAFDAQTADFSGIDGLRELYISNVIHQAEVIVDEQGTEAAAATAVGMAAGAAPPTDAPVPFVADHPFVIVLRDQETGANLFVGRVADPSAK
jgi:serpin B